VNFEEDKSLAALTTADKAWAMAAHTIYSHVGGARVPVYLADVAEGYGVDVEGEGPEADKERARRIARLLIGRALMRGLNVRDVTGLPPRAGAHEARASVAGDPEDAGGGRSERGDEEEARE
jgi:hypothetical protein